MPQVVYAQTPVPAARDSGRLADRVPTLIDLAAVPACAAAREQELGVGRGLGPHGLEQRKHLIAERRFMLAPLLGRGAGLGPNVAVEVELVPSSAQHFAAP